MERLGEVTVPSGTLTVLDPGHIGLFTDEQIPSVPVVEIDGLPTDRVLPVMGARVASGRWRGCWEHVEVTVADGPATSSEEVGEAMVEFARILLADSSNAT